LCIAESADFLNQLMTDRTDTGVVVQSIGIEASSGLVGIIVLTEKKMIEILRLIFIAVLYIFGIGIFGFFAAFTWALLIRVIRESKDD